MTFSSSPELIARKAGTRTDYLCSEIVRDFEPLTSNFPFLHVYLNNGRLFDIHVSQRKHEKAPRGLHSSNTEQGGTCRHSRVLDRGELSIR